MACLPRYPALEASEVTKSPTVETDRVTFGAGFAGVSY